MIADVMTKGLSKPQFEKLRKMIGLSHCPGNE
jgi:hypothetical protein